MKRREFLLDSAAIALGTVVLASRSVYAEETKKEPKLGLTTYMIGSKWTLPQLIGNLTRFEIFGLELRTDANFAHGVELNSDRAKRNEIKKRFADSPVVLVGMACGEKYDSPNPDVLKKSIERTKELLQLCADLGATGLRVFPDNFQADVPREKTLEQIAESLKTLAPTAESLNVEIRLEAHGNIGHLPNLETIAKSVDHPKVRIMLNSDFRDTQGDGLLANLTKVEQYLAGVAHIHSLLDERYTEAKYYETQTAFLKNAQWNGWCLLEIGDVADDEARFAELSRQKKRWEELIQSGRAI